MKIFSTLVMLLIGLQVIAAQPNKVLTGKVVEVSADRIALDQAAGRTYIGFVGEDDALTSLGNIKVGDEVRAVFGATHGPDGRSINKLLSIRVCTRNDQECSADFERQTIQDKQDAEKHDIAEKKYALCHNSMQATLSSDSRYIPKDSVQVSNDYLAKYNALTGSARTCASRLLKEHETSVLDACLLHHCGDNIGGGCWHIAGYATNSSAIQYAINRCSK